MTLFTSNSIKDTIDLFLNNEVKILHCCAAIMILVGLIVYCILLYIPATYGRYSNANSTFLFHGIPARVAWFFQELPSFLVAMVLIFIVQFGILPGSYTMLQLLVLGCFVFHYFQRTFIYSLSITGGKPTPFYAFALAFIFCTGNGYMQARGALLLSKYSSINDTFTVARVVIGLFLYVFGICANIQCDGILRNLRKPGDTGYKIPRGGLFEYVSCGNFLGEMIEWTGFAIASWSSVSFAFAFFTVCNLAPRAFSHHRFYLEKFDDYPRQRTAIIPYLL